MNGDKLLERDGQLAHERDLLLGHFARGEALERDVLQRVDGALRDGRQELVGLVPVHVASVDVRAESVSDEKAKG